jgi:Tol biopolymer transport system component
MNLLHSGRVWLACLAAPLCAIASSVPAWTPELAYVSIRTGDAHIWVRDTQGQEHQLTSAKSVHVQPKLAADGRIAFVGRDGARPVIFLMQADGSGMRRLSQSNDLETAPSWSSDARFIAYLASSQQDSAARLRVAEVQGGRITELPGIGNAIASFAPVWSADGERLLFMGLDAKGRSQAWVASRDGSNLRDVSGAHAPRGALWADLSPDGRQVAWVANLGAFGTQLMLTDLITAETRDLLAELPPAHFEMPRWSPDGKQLVFNATLRDAMANRADVYVLDIDRGALRNMTRHPADDFDARWSPDGQRVVFARLRDGGSALMQIDLQSGEMQTLTQHRSHDMEHSFRPRP